MKICENPQKYQNVPNSVYFWAQITMLYKLSPDIPKKAVFDFDY